MWTNWTGDQACSPAVLARPTSTDQVAEVLQEARRAGQNVRVAGAGHSFGDNVLTAGTMMSLDGLSGILGEDAQAGTVRVAAGTRLSELNRLLDERGLALANLGDIDTQSVAGAISTGTHGTGVKLGNLATLVRDVELVTAEGSLIRASDAGEAVLSASRLAVGALGVVTGYTLNVVPAFTLEGHQKTAPLAEILENLDAYIQGNDHFEFFTFPHSEEAVLKTTNRVPGPAPEAGKLDRVKNLVQGAMVENTALDLVSRLGRARPRLIPWLNRTATSLVSPTVKVDASHKVLASQRDVRFTESEWSVPLAAARTVLQEMREVIVRRGFDVNFPFEVRFVAGDTESMLSPAYGRDSCYIAAHSYKGMDFRPFFRAVQEIALAHGGRPHWGKRHTLSWRELAGLYPRWDEFLQVRDKLDPDRLFANDHARRIFGD